MQTVSVRSVRRRAALARRCSRAVEQHTAELRRAVLLLEMTRVRVAENGLRRRVSELDRPYRLAGLTSGSTEGLPAFDLLLRKTGLLLNAPVVMVHLKARGSAPAAAFRWHARSMSHDDAQRAYAQLDGIVDRPPTSRWTTEHEVGRPPTTEHGTDGLPTLVLVTALESTEGVAGCLLLLRHSAEHFSDHERSLAETIGADIVDLVALGEVHRLAYAAGAADERRRLAGELHDSAIQSLYSACMIAGVLPYTFDRDDAAGRHAVAELRGLMLTALAELRTMTSDLRTPRSGPTSLARLLHERADAFTARFQLPVDVVVTGEPSASSELIFVVGRVLGELLNNIARHAAATRVTIHLSETLGGGGVLDVIDDGRGLDPEVVRAGHYGLEIVRERITEVGGELTVISKVGQGTHVSVTWAGPENAHVGGGCVPDVLAEASGAAR